MTMNDLMEQILAILPNAVFGEEDNGEILIATGLAETPAGNLVGIDD
jgi:hypothetical protein